MNKDRNLLALGTGACMAAVAAFGLARLRAAPPHEDEVLALFLGRDSLGGMLDTVLTERGGAPLHYLLAWVVVHLGGSLDALRLVSLACAIASLPLIALLASRLVEPPRALAATVLASASWAFLFHALFGRMYALFLLTATASFLALASRRWGWWTIATLAALAAHPYGALLLAAQLLYLLITRTRSALPWAALVVAAAVPLWYADLVLAGRYGEGEGPKSTGGYVREAVGDLTSGYVPVLVVVAALAAVGFTRVRARALVACTLAAGLLAVALAQVRDASPESRHLIFLLPFAAVLVAAGLPRRAALAVPLVTALLVVEVAWAWHRTPDLFEGEPSAESRSRDEAGAWLAATAQPGDVLHGYHPVFLAAWEHDRSFPRRVVPRADARLALDELESAPTGRGVWVVDPLGTGTRLEARTFGRLTIVRSRAATGSPGRYLEQAEGVLAGVDLETVREARRRYERSSRSTASR
jgi:Dolichyl-phosphate-mannose-protein mannosyltransferase